MNQNLEIIVRHLYTGIVKSWWSFYIGLIGILGILAILTFLARLGGKLNRSLSSLPGLMTAKNLELLLIVVILFLIAFLYKIYVMDPQNIRAWLNKKSSGNTVLLEFDDKDPVISANLVEQLSVKEKSILGAITRYKRVTTRVAQLNIIAFVPLVTLVLFLKTPALLYIVAGLSVLYILAIRPKWKQIVSLIEIFE